MNKGNQQKMKRQGATRREMIVGSAMTIGCLTVGLPAVKGDPVDGISRTEEAIHQEVFFKASPQRVYELLTSAKEFAQVVALSAAVESGTVPKGVATRVSHEEGGEFLGFGGFILGRQVELIPHQRIVQAWRVSYWAAGIYSIVRFELTDRDLGTRLIFDHSGFPKGQAEHLAEGWKANYWEPMGKILG